MRALSIPLLPLAALAVVAACSDPNEPPVPGEPAAGVAEMQASAPSPRPLEDVWVTVRHGSATGLASPPDGDVWLHFVDRPRADVRVERVDLTNAGLEGIPDAIVMDAPDDEVLLRGTLETAVVLRPGELGATFDAFAAYRGMPGRAFTTADAFAQRGHPLAVAGAAIFGAVDLAGAEAPWLDRAWLEDQVAAHGAVVAGHEEWTTSFSGPRFLADQVFVLLPDRQGPCPTAAATTLRCPAGEAYTYARDVDRCLVPTGCARPGVCTMLMPRCDPGYVLRTWRAKPAACAAYACDPAFLAP